MRWFVLLGLGACGQPFADDPADTDDDTDVTACPAPTLDVYAEDGPVAYESRSTSWTVPWTGEAREIPMGLWGPTSATEGTPAQYLGIFGDPSSFDGAAVDLPPEGCKFPLVVWSHGSQAWQGNATTILRRLVRQGWILAAPDHVGNTLADNLENKPKSFPLLRTGDVSAVIDAIEDLPTTHPLAGRINTTNVLVAGHSFGGQTASLHAGPAFDDAATDARCGEGCSEAERAAFDGPVDDPRVTAVAPLAGFAGDDMVAASGWAATTRPMLYVTGTADFDGTPAFTRAEGANIAWIELDGACHESFTDTPVACPGFDKAEAHDLVASYLLAFASTRVLGLDDPEATALLDGSTSSDERATLRSSSRFDAESR